MNPRKMPQIKNATTTLNITQAIAYGKERGWPVTRQKINQALAIGYLEAMKDTMSRDRRTKTPRVYLSLEKYEYWVLNIMLIPYSKAIMRKPQPKGNKGTL
jgi:hypothetical protein